MSKQIRQKGFSIMLADRLEKDHPDIAKKLSTEEVGTIMSVYMDVLAELLRDGYRVIFEGYFSYFTKPIKRKCFNLYTHENWWTFTRRIRIKPLSTMKNTAETNLTEEEYQAYIEQEETKTK